MEDICRRIGKTNLGALPSPSPEWTARIGPKLRMNILRPLWDSPRPPKGEDECSRTDCDVLKLPLIYRMFKEESAILWENVR
jgi:hypothetical protein